MDGVWGRGGGVTRGWFTNNEADEDSFGKARARTITRFLELQRLYILLQSVILLCALLFYCVWFSLLSIELTEAVCAIVYVYVVVCVDGSCIVKAFRKLEAVQIRLRSCYNHQNSSITSSLLFCLLFKKIIRKRKVMNWWFKTTGKTNIKQFTKTYEVGVYHE